MLGYVLGQRSPTCLEVFFFFDVTCLRNDRKCSDTCTCNSPWPFWVPSPHKMREIEKRKRERQKGRKGKYNGDAIREFRKTKKKNDPSVIVFPLAEIVLELISICNWNCFLTDMFFFDFFRVGLWPRWYSAQIRNTWKCRDELYDEEKKELRQYWFNLHFKNAGERSTWVWLLPSKCKRP